MKNRQSPKKQTQKTRRQNLKSKFKKPRATEGKYARALKSVAREVDKLVKGFGDIDAKNLPVLESVLQGYSKILEPWAKATALSMIAHAEQQDKRVWLKATTEMGAAIRTEIRTMPTGHRLQELLNEQVTLIKSLPLKAAERVHKLATETRATSTRSTEIAKEIARTGEVTKARARTIARTEVARASSVLTQSRAEHLGSEGYIWRTVHDTDVRDSHKKMDGKYVKWTDPPTLDGLTGHAGQLPNCRCFAEPVIPQELLG